VGEARETFVDMNRVALRSPPAGANLDAESAYPRLGEIAVPTLVMCGDLDIPNTQDRSRYLAAAVPNGSYHEISGVAHLPSLERPAEVTRVIAAFLRSTITVG
jgi:pimeloyl-ACP methyl ester carboxylesterase